MTRTILAQNVSVTDNSFCKRTNN